MIETETDLAFLVAGNDERREGEATTALHPLGTAVDKYNLFQELRTVFHGSFGTAATAFATRTTRTAISTLAETTLAETALAETTALTVIRSGSGSCNSFGRSRLFFVVHSMIFLV